MTAKMTAEVQPSDDPTQRTARVRVRGCVVTLHTAERQAGSGLWDVLSLSVAAEDGSPVLASTVGRLPYAAITRAATDAVREEARSRFVFGVPDRMPLAFREDRRGAAKRRPLDWAMFALAYETEIAKQLPPRPDREARRRAIAEVPKVWANRYDQPTTEKAQTQALNKWRKRVSEAKTAGYLRDDGSLGDLAEELLTAGGSEEAIERADAIESDNPAEWPSDVHDEIAREVKRSGVSKEAALETVRERYRYRATAAHHGWAERQAELGIGPKTDSTKEGD